MRMRTIWKEGCLRSDGREVSMEDLTPDLVQSWEVQVWVSEVEVMMYYEIRSEHCRISSTQLPEGWAEGPEQMIETFYSVILYNRNK